MYDARCQGVAGWQPVKRDSIARREAMVQLQDLLIDTDEFDREVVAAALYPYLRIDRATGELIPLPPWERAPNDARVLLYLLAQRARSALALGPAGRGAAPAAIQRATGIPGGSVRPALQRLLRARVIVKQ